jgi:citrate lyase subunit beta/citryl-CoA lyase
MTVRLSPDAALFARAGSMPAWPPCVHYAGNARHVAQAMSLQAERGPVFDIAADCEDGAPGRPELEHARTWPLSSSDANRHDRVGAPARPRHRRGARTEILVGDAGPALPS